MSPVRLVKELKVPPERAVTALKRWAYEAIDLYEDDPAIQSCFVQSHNTHDLLQPLSETEVEEILQDACDNPESSSVGQLTSDAKSLGLHLEVPQNLYDAMRIVEQAGPETLEALLAPKAAETEAPKAAEQEASVSNWRDHFKSVGQLQDGDVRMILADFLPEGINFIGALSGHGKTLFALSMAKSFTTGERFLGKYKPEQIFPVLYLIPESSGRAFKMRCKAFGIPDDPNRFLCRTISDGVTLLLDDPIVLKAVQEMKPIVFLDTMIRFSESKDENSSAENQAVAKNVLALRAAGAISVIGLHHSIKSFADGEINLEGCLRGTGDIAALCDSVYALRRDRAIFDNGNGPEELDVVCVKDRDIRNPPKPFRIAARYIKEDGTRASFIDETGDFHLVESAAVIADLESKFVKIVAEGNPTINREDLAAELGISERALRKLANKLGWKRPSTANGAWAIFRKDPPPAPPVMPPHPDDAQHGADDEDYSPRTEPGSVLRVPKTKTIVEPEAPGFRGVNPGPPLN
jgi:hypothetical protein